MKYLTFSHPLKNIHFYKMKTIINVLNIKNLTYRRKLMEKAICLVLFPQLLLLAVHISSSALAHGTLIN